MNRNHQKKGIFITITTEFESHHHGCPSCLGLFGSFGYGSIPIHTIFSGMNIHLPAILMLTRCQGFDPSPFVGLVIHAGEIGSIWTLEEW